MKSLLLMLPFLFFLGCSQGNDNPTDYGPYPAPVGVDADLLPYVHEFESIYGLTVSYAVQYDAEAETGGNNPAGGTTVGVCRVWDSGRREVLVNKDWWFSKGDMARRLLIYHELGHCSFDRDHDSRKYSNGMPFSIMNPILNPVITWYPSKTAYYLDELDSASMNTGLADNSPAPTTHAATFEEPSQEEGLIKIKEFHSMGSAHADHVGCEEFNRTYLDE